MTCIDLNSFVRGAFTLRTGKDLHCFCNLRNFDIAPKLPKHSVELHLWQNFEALIDLLMPFLAPTEHQKIVLFLSFFIDRSKLTQCLHLLLIGSFALFK